MFRRRRQKRESAPVHSTRRAAAAIALACVAILFAGCTVPVEQHDWSHYDGPGAEYLHEPQYQLPFHDDPLEPVNRVFTGINTVVVVGVGEPVASGWRLLVPQEVRTPLVRAADNLEYPRRGLNNLLQGNLEGAGDETARFALNTTVGIVGLDDAAQRRGISPANTDTGTTLKKAGWRNSVYFTPPFGMPGTVRDVVGGVGDTLLDPTYYFFPALPIKGFIQAAERMDGYEKFLTTNQDAYEPMRRMYQARREAEPIAPLESASNGPALQSLGYAMLAPRDPAFDLRYQYGRARIAATGESLPYSAWMQKRPAPLVVLLPGFGGHRLSFANLAVAEMFYDAGYSVVTISSAANFEFMRNAATALYPGFMPADASDVQRAVATVCRELEGRYGNRIKKRALVGVSFGGCHTLYLAAMSPRDRLIDFDAYLAICPPVQFEHAAEVLDSYYNLPLTFPETNRDERVAAIMKKGSVLMAGGPAGRRDVDLTEGEAEFLVGLSYRLALHDVIWVSRERHDAGILKTKWNALQRASASQEILGYSMMKYAYAFLLPTLLKAPAVIDTPDEMLEHSDLRRLEGWLRSRRNVGVAFNENDFLLAKGDAAWLRSVFGERRLVVSETGAHVGNLGEDAWRARIVDLLKHLLGTSGTRDD